MKDRKARVENGGIKEGREKVRGVSKKATIQEHIVFPRRCSTIAPDFSLEYRPRRSRSQKNTKVLQSTSVTFSNLVGCRH